MEFLIFFSLVYASAQVRMKEWVHLVVYMQQEFLSRFQRKL